VALERLAEALAARRLAPPYSDLALKHYLPEPEAAAVATELQHLAASGVGPEPLAHMLRLLGEERTEQQQAGDRVELVWSGPEVDSASTRDTGVVVRELFAEARHSVLVAGFAVWQGKHVFKVLADRMDADAGLVVRMFLNVARPHGDDRSEAEILRRFAEEFRQHEWSGQRLPRVFFDPRAVTLGAGPKTSLHAKCIVVDDERTLVTSANFTEAAQERNIEAGVLITDPIFARSLRAQFETLVARGMLKSVPGLG
jgi:phosphatidylserine/phosphatidylglycerophosphate/cardiolipin synthase-like enzyme